MVAAGLQIPVVIVKGFLKSFLQGVAIEITGKKVKTILNNVTLASEIKEYKWKLVDKNDTSIKEYAKRARYKIISDTLPSVKNKIYYEGWTPSDYDTEDFRAAAHSAVFGY